MPVRDEVGDAACGAARVGRGALRTNMEHPSQTELSVEAAIGGLPPADTEVLPALTPVGKAGPFE